MGLLIQFCSADVIRTPQLGFYLVWLLYVTLCFHPECYLIAHHGSRCSLFRTTSARTEAKVVETIQLYSFLEKEDTFILLQTKTWVFLRVFSRRDCSLDIVFFAVMFNLDTPLCH